MEAPRESIEDSDGSLRQHIVPQLTPAAAAIESALGTSRPESPSAFPSLRLSSSPSAPGVCERTSQSARDRAASLLRALQAKHPVLRDPVVVRAFNASLEAVGVSLSPAPIPLSPPFLPRLLSPPPLRCPTGPHR